MPYDTDVPSTVFEGAIHITQEVESMLEMDYDSEDICFIFPWDKSEDLSFFVRKNMKLL